MFDESLISLALSLSCIILSMVVTGRVRLSSLTLHAQRRLFSRTCTCTQRRQTDAGNSFDKASLSLSHSYSLSLPPYVSLLAGSLSGPHSKTRK